MINTLRSIAFHLYMKLLNEIDENVLDIMRVVFLVFICVIIICTKTIRMLLYVFKINSLRRRQDPTQYDLFIKNLVLKYEIVYRYLLNGIIIVSYIFSVIMIESMMQKFNTLLCVIIYFILDISSKSFVSRLPRSISPGRKRPYPNHLRRKTTAVYSDRLRQSYTTVYGILRLS